MKIKNLILAASIALCISVKLHANSSENIEVLISGILGSSHATNSIVLLNMNNKQTMNQLNGAFDPNFLIKLSDKNVIYECQKVKCVAVLNYVNLTSDDPFNYELQFYSIPELKLVKVQKIKGNHHLNSHIYSMSSSGDLLLQSLDKCHLSGGAKGGIGCRYIPNYYLVDYQGKKFKSDKSIALSSRYLANKYINFSPLEKTVFYVQQNDLDSLPFIRLQSVDKKSNKLTSISLQPKLDLLKNTKFICMNYVNDNLFYVVRSDGNVYLYSSSNGTSIPISPSKVVLNTLYSDGCDAEIKGNNLTISIKDSLNVQTLNFLIN